MSRRADILAEIGARLAAVAGFTAETVHVGQLTDQDLDGMPLPTAFVLQGPESKPSQVIQAETWEWTISVEVWCKQVDVEALYAAVHAAVVIDYTLGGRAMHCWRDGGDVLQADPARGVAAFQQVYRVQYRHAYGTP